MDKIAPDHEDRLVFVCICPEHTVPCPIHHPEECDLTVQEMLHIVQTLENRIMRMWGMIRMKLEMKNPSGS